MSKSLASTHLLGITGSVPLALWKLPKLRVFNIAANNLEALTGEDLVIIATQDFAYYPLFLFGWLRWDMED